MNMFKPVNRLDRFFLIGLILKGLDALFETLSGIILFIIRPDQINHLVRLLIYGELNENPHDIVANHILHWSQDLSKSALVFGAIYLLAHGIAKLILVIEIIRDHLWAYIGLICITAIFIIYQVYEIFFSHSISMILLTIFDAIIVYLTAKEYQKRMKVRT